MSLLSEVARSATHTLRKRSAGSLGRVFAVSIGLGVLAETWPKGDRWK
jgi:hypothetical protein